MTSLNNLIESVIVHAKHRDIITISKVFRVNLTKNKILLRAWLKLIKFILTKRFYFWLTLFKLQYFDKSSCHYQAKLVIDKVNFILECKNGQCDCHRMIFRVKMISAFN